MYIAIEGAVGCGKSTLFNLLKERYPSALFFKEPIEKFRQFEEHNPLLLAYIEPGKNVGFSQMHIIDQSCAYYRNVSPHSNKLILSERSVISPVIFSHALRRLEYLSDFSLDYALFHWREKSSDVAIPDYVIFLDVNPSICQHRVSQRGRMEEIRSAMPELDYQRSVRDCYLKYFSLFLPDPKTFKVFELGSDESVQSVLDKICSFLNSIGCDNKE